MEQQGSFFTQRTLDAGGRKFEINAQRFDNGMFVSISEGGHKIGPVTVSLASNAGPEPVTMAVIPSRDSTCTFFMKMASGQISSRLNGIAIISVSALDDLTMQISKALLEDIVEMTKYEKSPSS